MSDACAAPLLSDAQINADEELTTASPDETHATLSTACYVGTWNLTEEECADAAKRLATFDKAHTVLRSFPGATGRLQMERGRAGNWHVQWTLQLEKKMLARTFRKLLDTRQTSVGLAMKTWFQRRRGTQLQSVQYCSKVDTKVQEPGLEAWVGGLTLEKCTRGVSRTRPTAKNRGVRPPVYSRWG